MPTTYMEILAIQEPTDIGVDASNRAMFANNYQCQTAGVSDRFEQEIVKLITNVGLATSGANIFIGSRVVLPAGDGPFIRVRATGGLSPLESHDGRKQERPSCQVVVYGMNYDTARIKAYAIYRLLDGQRNVVIAA